MKLTVPVNNKVLLQLHGIREDTGCSLASIQTLFDEVSINAGVPTQNVGHLIQTCLYRLDIKSKKNNNDISSFLNKGLEMEWIGEFSKKHCVKRLSVISGRLWLLQHHLDNDGVCLKWAPVGTKQFQK